MAGTSSSPVLGSSRPGYAGSPARWPWLPENQGKVVEVQSHQLDVPHEENTDWISVPRWNGVWQSHLGSVRRNTRNSAPREEKVESSSHCPIHQSQTRGAFGAGGAVCKKSVCVQTYACILLSQISVFLGLAEAGKYSSSSRPPHSKAYSLLRRRRWAEPVTAGRKPKDDPVPPAPLQPRTLKTRGTSKRPSLQSSGEERGQAPPISAAWGVLGTPCLLFSTCCGSPLSQVPAFHQHNSQIPQNTQKSSERSC